MKRAEVKTLFRNIPKGIFQEISELSGDSWIGGKLVN